MEAEITEVETNDNIDKISTSTSCSTAFLLEVESKTNENQKLREKVIKAKLTIEHLEKMITTSALQLGQLTAECVKTKKEHAHQRKEAEKQKSYQLKEIETLMAELALSKSLLDGRITRLERMNSRNTALQNEVTNNRYKIFSMHFKSSADDATDHSHGSESSQTATELSNDAASDDNETPKSTTSEELESTADNYST